MRDAAISARQWIAARTGLRLTQAELADMANVSRGTVGALESAQYEVLPNNRAALIEAFRREGVTFESDVDTESVVFHRERLPLGS